MSNERHILEVKELSDLALKQLNLPKNKNKCDFKNLELDDIILGIYEEVEEVLYELDTKKIDRLYEEIGDVAAYLCGLLSWVKHNLKE